MEDLNSGDERRTWFRALRHASIGWEMGISVGLGLLVGWWLDKKFDTKPFFFIGLMLVGIAAGFYALIRTAGEVRRSQRDEAQSRRMEHDERQEEDEQEDGKMDQNEKA